VTPGAYLKLRRTAAHLSIADVAANIATEPPTAEHTRVQWIELIEADATPAKFSTIVALGRTFSFDIHVLAQLEASAQGATLPLPPICRICGCTELDACDAGHGDGCAWAEDDLCSVCAR
jgi:hypothetical protein